MNRSWGIRAAGVVALFVLSLLMLVPTFANLKDEAGQSTLPGWFTKVFSKKLVLGLDLQGGIHLQYKVDVAEALGRRTASLAGSLEVQLKEEAKVIANATPSSSKSLDEVTQIEVTFASADEAAKLDTDFLSKFGPGYTVARSDGATVTIEMLEDDVLAFQQQALEQAMQTVERRINEFGVSESSVTRRGESEIVVQLPGIKESEFSAAKEKLSQTGQLRFQIVDRDGASAFVQKVSSRIPDASNWPAELSADLKIHKVDVRGGTLRSTSKELLSYVVEGQLDDNHLVGFQQYWTDPKDSTLDGIDSMTVEQERYLEQVKPGLDQPVVRAYELYYLFRKEGMSGENVKDGYVGYDDFNRPDVRMEFEKVDADEFLEMTTKFTNQLMAIMIDDEVFSAPNIKEPIGGGHVRIELGASFGTQAMKEARALVAVLKAGALQAPLRKLYDSQIGPTLGADSVEDGKNSLLAGGAGVLLFMLAYYKFSGLVASAALMFNLLITLAMMSAFGATLTLPGIAGMVLSLGMSIDANVLIYERIREEIRAGTTIRKAIEAGYDKAFWSIFDGNITAVIAGVVLYQYGSGPVRGFAVTLCIGVLASMFTALIVTRLIFDRIYFRGDEPRTMSV